MSTKRLVDPNSSASQQPTNVKGMKRKQAAILHGDSSATQSRETGLTCPICFHLIDSAYMTECGHSFCHKCIMSFTEKKNQCPKCNSTLNPDRLFPNFTLNELILQHKQKLKASHSSKGASNTASDYNQIINDLFLSTSVSQPTNYQDVSSLIEVLQQKQRRLLLESKIGHANLTMEFLSQIKSEKDQQLKALEQELNVITDDISQVSMKTQTLKQEEVPAKKPALTNGSSPSNDIDTLSNAKPTVVTDAAIRQRISSHSADLHDLYFSMRSKAMIGGDRDEEGLEEFSSALSKFVKYKEFRHLATLNYTSDMYNMYSIVSSIEFDKDADYFAIAGVTKKIKVYDYNQVVSDVVDVHYPITEMACASKISCVAWNPYHKNELASSDYEGTVTMWDPFTGKKTHMYQEHEKRCWCVDFSRMNPHLMASGSDDSKVKIWSTNSARSVLNIEALANVCCVKFNPSSSYHLTFGAADHCVHYYDLRKPTEPLLTFKGHLKAVSYAKFLNGDEIVSASTDSQLKLWNVKKGTTAVRTFRGHTNEKNFVGLASDNDFIACGSEDNSLCVYYKGLGKILHKYKFEIVRSVWQREAPRDEDSNEFVSAVSWKPDSGVVIVANSQGIVKILELL